MKLRRVNSGTHILSDVRELPPRARSRQTHYDTLGLSPTATPGEVIQAFARKMGTLTPRSVADLAQLSVAYETLRDPQKRRAYDASLRPTPTPAAMPTSKAPEPHYAVNWRPAPVGPSSALIDRLSRPAEVERPTPAPSPRIQPKPEVAPSPPKLTEPTPDSDAERLQFLPDFRSEVRPAGRADQGSIDLKRAALALAWPIMGIAVLGGVAGWAASISEAPEQPEPTTRRALLSEEPKFAAGDASLYSATPDERSMEPQAPKPSTATRIKSKLPAPLPAPTEVAASDPLLPDPAVEDAANPEPAAEAVSARMPLSNQTIARTIGRIGYACGEVTSTAPVEGEGAGVFKVTCSSGKSYQARPIGGRYHFRRWNRS